MDRRASIFKFCLLLTVFTQITAQHCLYPFHKHVRLPGIDKKTFRECVPPGKFDLKDCPGDSEYDIHLQACKFPEGSVSSENEKLASNTNTVQDRLGKSVPVSPIGGNLIQQPQSLNPPSIVQFSPQSNQQPIGQQGQWIPVGTVPDPVIEILQNCVLDGWCPHDPKKLQYCDLNGQQFLQCSPSGWVMKTCPFGTHFVGPVGRCVDPREAGAGGSVLPPPFQLSSTSVPASNIPFAPPGMQMGSQSAPNAPNAPPPSPGTWIGNSIPISNQPMAQPGSISGGSAPILAPPQPQVPVPKYPSAASQPTPQHIPSQSTSTNANDLALQKLHELPQGQLVIIGNQPNGNGQIPFPNPQQFQSPIGKQNPEISNWPQPPNGNNGAVQPVPSPVGVAHPKSKILSPSFSAHSVSTEIGGSNELGSNAELPTRWNPNPAANAGAENNLNPTLIAPPSSNFHQSTEPQTPQRPAQNWVLGGNVNNYTPNMDVRELPMGTWVQIPAPPQQTQSNSASTAWNQQRPSELRNNFQNTDTVISRRYASAVSDLDHAEKNENQGADENEDKKKL